MSKGYLGKRIGSPAPRRRMPWALGFEVVSRLPPAFHHPIRGFVDVLVMFRAL
jgi:hypothetical protein